MCAPDATEIDDGLMIQDRRCGDGDPAARGDLLQVTYSGALQDGEVFERIQDPYRFRLGVGEVIEGWDEGIKGMQEGGVRELIIPPELGYGSTGLAPDIPPGATLIYTIELVAREEPE